MVDKSSIFAFDAVDFIAYMYFVHERGCETMHVFIFKLDKITSIFLISCWLANAQNVSVWGYSDV